MACKKERDRVVFIVNSVEEWGCLPFTVFDDVSMDDGAYPMMVVARTITVRDEEVKSLAIECVVDRETFELMAGALPRRPAFPTRKADEHSIAYLHGRELKTGAMRPCPFQAFDKFVQKAYPYFRRSYAPQ
jgi:hypothetical protein